MVPFVKEISDYKRIHVKYLYKGNVEKINLKVKRLVMYRKYERTGKKENGYGIAGTRIE